MSSDVSGERSADCSTQRDRWPGNSDRRRWSLTLTTRSEKRVCVFKPSKDVFGGNEKNGFVLTTTSLRPARAKPSPTPAVGLASDLARFRWNSLLALSAVTPFPTDDMTFDPAPVTPPAEHAHPHSLNRQTYSSWRSYSFLSYYTFHGNDTGIRQN